MFPEGPVVKTFQISKQFKQIEIYLTILEIADVYVRFVFQVFIRSIPEPALFKRNIKAKPSDVVEHIDLIG